MCQEVGDGDFGGFQAVLLRAEVHPTATGAAAARLARPAALAHHVVGDVLPATLVLRGAPLQVH